MSTPDHDATRDLDVELSSPGIDDDPAFGPEEEELEADQLGVAFSPRQILGGFALLAAIIVWLFRRRGKGG